MLKLVDKAVIPLKEDHDSLFIACVSYEDRSVLAARKLSADYQTDSVIIFQSAEYRNMGKTPEHLQELLEILRNRSSSKAQELVFSIHKPTDFLGKFREVIYGLAENNPFRAVTVDISTFPRQELLVLLRFIDMHPKRGIVRLLYAEPRKYATEETIADEGWLTRGVRSVHSIPSFGGIQLPQRFKLLVIIIGHEGERTHITLRRHQPDKVILIPQGKEQHHPGLRQIAEHENNQIISVYGPDCLWKYGLPSRGVTETEQVIKEIYQQHRYTHNMFLAANGTKLQLIGAYLACRLIREIQITYAVPALYNWQKYSTGTSRLSEMILEPQEPFD